MANPLAANLNPLATAANTIAALGNIVVVTADTTHGYQPLKPKLKGGVQTKPQPSLMFHYEGEQIANIESDITDHFIEDNTAVADHIAIKPETFKTSGYIGEVNNVLPLPLQLLQRTAEVLVAVRGYFPQLSITALRAYNQALLIYETAESVYESAISTYASFSDDVYKERELRNPFTDADLGSGTLDTGSKRGLPSKQTEQQVMFQQLYAYWYTRTLFNIQTPWCIFTNMAILSLRAIQDADTRLITDFEITFKKIRTANSVTEPSKLKAGRDALQSAKGQNNRVTGGSESPSLGTKLKTLWTPGHH